MNEQQFAYRIRQSLNRGLMDVPPAAARRLEAARHLALSRQKTSLQMALAGSNQQLTLNVGNSLISRRAMKQVLAILALLTGMWLSFYWNSVQYVQELEEVDSALLADELPPEVLLDNEFIEWLKDDTLAQ